MRGANKIQKRNAKSYEVLKKVRDGLYGLQRDCRVHPVFRQMQNRLFAMGAEIDKFFQDNAEAVETVVDKRRREVAESAKDPKVPVKPEPVAAAAKPNSLEI